MPSEKQIPLFLQRFGMDRLPLDADVRLLLVVLPQPDVVPIRVCEKFGGKSLYRDVFIDDREACLVDLGLVRVFGFSAASASPDLPELHPASNATETRQASSMFPLLLLFIFFLPPFASTFIQSRVYPLMAPIMTPFTKYLCRNGYRMSTGMLATTSTAYLMPSTSRCCLIADSVDILTMSLVWP